MENVSLNVVRTWKQSFEIETKLETKLRFRMRIRKRISE